MNVDFKLDGSIVEKLFTLMPPPEAAKFYQKLLEVYEPLEFSRKFRDYIAEKVEIIGKGLTPKAVTLGGLMSIPGAIVVTALFPEINTIITSPQVYEGKIPVFQLSHRYMKKYAESGYNIVTVDFQSIPEYDDAVKLIEIMKEGAIIVQGISAELALWLGRNSGIGRVAVYRPLGGKAIIRYI